MAEVADNINGAVDDINEFVKGLTALAENIMNSEKELRENIFRVNELTEQISKVLAYTKK